MPASTGAPRPRLQRWAARGSALLWSPAWAGYGPLTAGVAKAVRLVYAVLRDLVTGQLGLRATGLVYVTILSLVPVVAISFSVLKAIGVHRSLAPLLGTWLAPLGADGERVAGLVVGFVERVQGNVLAGVGLALLFLTTIAMAQRMEASLNFVWRVDRPRNLARRLADYFAVLLVGPVVIVAVLALFAALARAGWLQNAVGPVPLAWIASLWGRIAPYVLVCAAFTFVYWFVPNTRVEPRAAAGGGVVGGLLWAAAGGLFARFAVNSAQTLSIYSTFAIGVTALIWLHLCWLLLLVGAQVAFYLQHPDYLRLGYRSHEPGTRDTETLAITVMLRVAGAF